MGTITEGEAAEELKASFSFEDERNQDASTENDEEQPPHRRMPSTTYSQVPSTNTLQTTARRRRTSALMFEEIQQEHKDSVLEKKGCSKGGNCGPFFGGSLHHPGCPHCADRDRDHLRQFRRLAQDYPNVYSWICVDPEPFRNRWPKDFVLVFLGISIQVVTPVAIALQLHAEIPNGSYCGHKEKDGHGVDNLDMGRYLAFVLSFYFGVVSIHSFLGKVKGNAFLMIFSSINKPRKTILVIGFLAQLLGLVAANVAEYFLFVGRGREDFLLLLFTSTTMQATLNADSNNLISITRATKLDEIVSKILSDECLNLGEKGDPELPKELTANLIRFRFVYDAMTLLLLAFVIFLTGMVTHCI